MSPPESLSPRSTSTRTSTSLPPDAATSSSTFRTRRRWASRLSSPSTASRVFLASLSFLCELTGRCFRHDTDAETKLVQEAALAAGADAAVPCTLWAEGGLGALELGNAVIEACKSPNPFKFLYELDTPIKSKIEAIATEMYGAKDVSYSEQAEAQIAQYTKQGFGNLPICMAKTHLSLSHDPKAKGAPTGEFAFVFRVERC